MSGYPLDLKFDFEDWKQTNMGYYDMQIKTSEGFYVKMWDSGNPGIAIVNKGKEFPTSHRLPPKLTVDNMRLNWKLRTEE